MLLPSETFLWLFFKYGWINWRMTPCQNVTSKKIPNKFHCNITLVISQYGKQASKKIQSCKWKNACAIQKTFKSSYGDYYHRIVAICRGDRQLMSSSSIKLHNKSNLWCKYLQLWQPYIMHTQHFPMLAFNLQCCYGYYILLYYYQPLWQFYSFTWWLFCHSMGLLTYTL